MELDEKSKVRRRIHVNGKIGYFETRWDLDGGGVHRIRFRRKLKKADRYISRQYPR